MFEHYSGRTVVFDPAATVLRPCAGGWLADCRSATGGPAIRLVHDEEDSYAFWTTVGLVGGAPLLVR
jgi:hypothetical protein